MAFEELIKIISVNVNSFVTNYKRYGLLGLLNQHNPDIACLCETKLNQIHQLAFKNYNLLRRDRPHSIQGGGTTILIREGIMYEEIAFRGDDSSVLESCAVKIKLTGGKSLTIVSVYAPHNNKKKFIN